MNIGKKIGTIVIIPEDIPESLPRREEAAEPVTIPATKTPEPERERELVPA